MREGCRKKYVRVIKECYRDVATKVRGKVGKTEDLNGQGGTTPRVSPQPISI